MSAHDPSQRQPPPDDSPGARDAEREPPRRPSQPPPESRGIEGLLAEILRRGMSASRGPLEKVGHSTFPRDVTAALISQLGDVRSGVVKAVAQEVGRFLREADIASEARKVLLGLDVEASVKLRFNQRADGSLETEVEEIPEKRPAARRKSDD